MLEEKSNHPSFEQFRSSTCHKHKDLGDRPFITQPLETRRSMHESSSCSCSKSTAAAIWIKAGAHEVYRLLPCRRHF